MSRPQHTVSIAFVRSALRRLDGAARLHVLDAAGIAPGLLALDQARVPAAAFAALWLAVARELDDEFFGLDTRRMKVGSFALLCHAVVDQPTVERALKQALRGLALFLDDIEASLVVADAEARVVIVSRIAAPLRAPGTRADGAGPTRAERAAVVTKRAALAAAEVADARRFADETLLVMVHGLPCWLAGRRVALLRLEWAHPRPAHADEYRRMFSPVLRFDRPASAIVFDARVLRAAVSMPVAALEAFLRDAPQSVFLKQVAHGGWSEQVRRRWRQALRTAGAAPEPAPLHAGPTPQAMAQACGVSPATLRRRLEGEGASWQQLKNEVRRDLAIHLLAETRLGIDEVAARLGFRDTSSFHRAFRNWTGAPPGSYRSVRTSR